MKKALLFRSFLFLFTFAICSSCYQNCAEDKAIFLEDYQDIMKEIKQASFSTKELSWDGRDARFRRLIKECQPFFSSKLTIQESQQFWSEAMAYLCLRYGSKVLNKYKDTDDLILRVRDSLQAYQIKPYLALDSLQSSWPTLQQLDIKTKEKMSRVFEKAPRPQLLKSGKKGSKSESKDSTIQG